MVVFYELKILFDEYMSINISLPDSTDLKPKITVVGVGGAGGNAVSNMIEAELEGVEFWVANTDAQALDHSKCKNRLQLGSLSTRGLGAGAAPEVGKKAAEESMSDLENVLDNTNMIFITAGMGGGTGTGAAPVIAKAAKEKGVLTVGVVTKPFQFEGMRRMKIADQGLEELNRYVDTLIVIPNQNLFRIANENTTFADAFKMADDVLHSGVRGITDLITMPGLINLDFADIRTVMSEMGKAMMGTGEAEGENRAILAAEAAISNPLLDHSSMKGARGVLINITGGSDMTLYQVDAAANRIKEEVDPNANIIFGSAFNPNLTGRIRVSVVATGIDNAKANNSLNVAQNIVNEQPAQEDRYDANVKQSQSYMNSMNRIAEEEDEDDSGAFISPRVAEPSAYVAEFNVEEEEFEADNSNEANENIDEDDFQKQEESKQVINAPIAAPIREDEEESNKKQGSDFFDIPAFIRKKMKM